MTAKTQSERLPPGSHSPGRVGASVRPARRRVLLLVALATGVAATAVQGWQGGGPADDLRSLAPAEQRAWIEARLAQLQREQAELRTLLARLDNGETIDTPYPLMPGWQPDPAPRDDGFGPARSLPEEDHRPLPARDIEPVDWSKLSAQQRQTYHTLAQELAPEMSAELEQMRQSEPQRYDELMSRNLARLAEMVQLRDRDQEVYRLRARDSELARLTVLVAARAERSRAADDLAEAAAAEDELRELVDEHFDVRQKIRAHELDRLAVRLRDLEEEFTVRNEKKADLVGSRLDELLDRFQQNDEGRVKNEE